MESGHLEASWVTTTVRAESRLPSVRSEVRGQPGALGWGRKLKGSCFFTEPKNHSVIFNSVPQSAEMEVELVSGGVNCLGQDLFMRKIVQAAFCCSRIGQTVGAT